MSYHASLSVSRGLRGTARRRQVISLRTYRVRVEDGAVLVEAPEE